MVRLFIPLITPRGKILFAKFSHIFYAFAHSSVTVILSYVFWRISAATAVFGTIPNIKPHIAITDDGTLKNFGKCKSERRALKELADIYKKTRIFPPIIRYIYAIRIIRKARMRSCRA